MKINNDADWEQGFKAAVRFVIAKGPNVDEMYLILNHACTEATNLYDAGSLAAAAHWTGRAHYYHKHHQMLVREANCRKVGA